MTWLASPLTFPEVAALAIIAAVLVRHEIRARRASRLALLRDEARFLLSPVVDHSPEAPQ